MDTQLTTDPPTIGEFISAISELKEIRRRASIRAVLRHMGHDVQPGVLQCHGVGNAKGFSTPDWLNKVHGNTGRGSMLKAVPIEELMKAARDVVFNYRTTE